MKTLHKFRLSNIIAAAAIAGLSFSAAYAVSYDPEPNSPLNANDGGVNLGAGLAAINAYLPVGTTLVLPAGVNVKPTKDEFKLAVKAAALAAGTVAQKAAIVRSALFVGGNTAYGYAVTKDVIKDVMGDYLADGGYSQANAQIIIDAALSVNNGKSNDVMAGLILAIGARTSSTQEMDAAAFAGDALATLTPITEDSSSKGAKLIEGVAENIIKNMKPSGSSSAPLGFDQDTLQARADAAITDMIAQILASPAYADDVTRGAMKGIKGLLSKGATYTLSFNAIGAAFATASIDTKAHALSGMIRVLFSTDTAELAAAKAAFGNDVLLDAVVDGYALISEQTGGADARQARFADYAAANPTKAAYYALGGVYLSPGLAPLFAESGIASVMTAPQKAKLIGLLSRAQNAQAGKVAGAAAIPTSGLTVAQVLNAVIPNTTSLYTGSVVKEVAKAATSTTTADLTTAAVNAIEAAVGGSPEDDYKGGTIDAISELMKARKTEIALILSAGIAAADAGAGTREQIAAALGRGENKVDHQAALTTALAGASAAEIASVLAAEEVARLMKTNPKTALQIALDAVRSVAPASLGGVVIGAGSINTKLVNVVMVSALRQGNGTLSTGDKSRILDLAKAANKKSEGDIQLAFDTAQLVLANPDEIFDIVDHQAIKYAKSIPTIAGAAAAAAPGYANTVAHAAGFRATTASVSKIPAAIFDGADMNANLTSNPSASAAIAAAFIEGIMDAQQESGTQEKLLTSGMFSLVKAAMTIGSKGTLPVGSTPGTGTFRGVNIDTGAAPTGATEPEYGSAAVVTGATSIMTAPSDTTPSAALIMLLNAAGKAVGHGTHNQATVIAQAAAQAIASIASGYTQLGYDAIATAIQAGSGAVLGAIQTAIASGRAEALASHYGAGAAGVLNYAHRNLNNSPVTDIAGF